MPGVPDQIQMFSIQIEKRIQKTFFPCKGEEEKRNKRKRAKWKKPVLLNGEKR
jgi:hypothetical protein